MGNSNWRTGYALLAVALAAIVFGGCKPRSHTSREWLNPEYRDAKIFHGSAYESPRRLFCAFCHGRKFEGRKIGRIEVPGCSTCHFGPGGERVPQGVLWEHGSADHNTQVASGAVCDACHDLYTSYGLEPQTCHGCHAHITGQPWLDPKSPRYHGNSTMQCSNCHDPNTKCATCHFGPSGSKKPDGSGWTHGMMPYDSLSANGAVCNQCHSLDRSYGNGPIACHDCHTHAKGQPWMDSKNPDYHGTSTIQCSSCHDNPAVTTKCANCHFDDATGSKTPDPGWTHGTTPHEGFTPYQGAVCNTCHTVSRSYGNGPASCHDCHTHVTGQPWLDRNSPEFHATSALECSKCHNLSTECSTCHFGPTGSKVPDGSGWMHGTMPHDSLEAYGAVCNQCHSLDRSYGNGPASCHDCHQAHAVPFTNHGATAKQNLVYCQSCHAQPADGGPGSDPRFNVPRGSLAAGCESSGCHNQKTAHPVPWKGADATSHQTAGNMENACVLCHGATFAGGAGPACSTCHTKGLPTVMKNCTSCHTKPPSTGRHTKHNALPEVATVCSTCHSGAGSQTAGHQNGTVEVSIAGFNAKSGAASFSAAGKTCANVSCHGGQVTPRWDTGAIDVNTQCMLCHSGSSTQYNSYRSGEHQKHVVDLGAACTECHDTTKLATVHFNDLSTTAMTQASLTILSDRHYNGSSCLFTCHLNNEVHDRGMTW